MGRATDFSNCYIYHIVDSDKVIHYVGSTSNMNSRKSKHKYNCSHEHCEHYHFDIYQYIRNNGGWNEFEVVPIRKIENISNKTDLRIAEREEMEKFTGLKNMRGSYLSTEEQLEQKRESTKIWRKQNPEKNAEHQRQWRQNNPEKKSESSKKWYEANKEKVMDYQRKYREQKKQLKETDQ